MSQSQLSAFIEKLSSDSELQKQMKAEGANAIEVGQAAGFDITHEDLEEHASDEISLDNLKSVAGGGSAMSAGRGFSTNKAFRNSFKNASKAYPDFWVPTEDIKNNMYPDFWKPTQNMR